MEENKQIQKRPLETIESEINFYKQQTAIGIIEIGKRLIEAKTQLNHGEWGKWLEEKVEFSQWTANKFMKCAKEFSNCGATNNLPQEKLFKLLDVPQEEREEFINTPHEINGQTKTVDEMTTRELQKVIKEKKELEKQMQDKEYENNKLKADLEREKNNIKTKEVAVEIDNTDYSAVSKLKRIEEELNNKKTEVDRLQRKLELANEKAEIFEKNSEEYKALKRQIEVLGKEKDDISKSITSGTELAGLVHRIEGLLKTELCPITYSRAIIDMSENDTVMKNLQEIIEVVEKWCGDMRTYLPQNQQNIIIEVKEN